MRHSSVYGPAIVSQANCRHIQVLPRFFYQCHSCTLFFMLHAVSTFLVLCEQFTSVYEARSVFYKHCITNTLQRWRRVKLSVFYRLQELRYKKTIGDEVEDLEKLLVAVKQKHPDIQAVSSGAIASNYQRLRVESICSRLGLISLAYMWEQDQATLLQNIVSRSVDNTDC
jgi:hypothetical protein